MNLEAEAFFDLGEHTVTFHVLHGRGLQSGAHITTPAAHVCRRRDGLIVYFKGYVHRESRGVSRSSPRVPIRRDLRRGAWSGRQPAHNGGTEMALTKIRTTIATLAAAFAVAMAVTPAAQAAATRVPIGTPGGTAPTTTHVMESKNDGRYAKSSEAFKKKIQSVCATYAEAILYYQALYHHEKAHDPNSQATADALKRWDAALNEYERLCAA